MIEESEAWLQQPGLLTEESLAQAGNVECVETKNMQPVQLANPVMSSTQDSVFLKLNIVISRGISMSPHTTETGG
eukprot:1307588-Amphidinium_carterae.1